MFNDSLFVVFGSSFVPFDIAKIRWFLVSFQLFPCFSSQKHATISPFCDRLKERPSNLSQRFVVRHQIMVFIALLCSFVKLTYSLMAFPFVFLRQLRMHCRATTIDSCDNLKAGITADLTHGTDGTT